MRSLKTGLIALLLFVILVSSLVPVFATSENERYVLMLEIRYTLWAYPNEEIRIVVDFGPEPVPPPPAPPTTPTASPTPSPLPTPPPIPPEKFAGIPLRFELRDENGVLMPISPPIPEDCETGEHGWFETAIRAPEEEGEYTLTVFATYEGEVYSASELLPVSTKERPTLPTPLPTLGPGSEPPTPTPGPTPTPSPTPTPATVPTWMWVVIAALAILIVGAVVVIVTKRP